MGRQEYKTRQGELILSYLKSKTGYHVTAGDIISDLKKNGVSMGLATVYRRLDKLIKDGVVIKYSLDGKNGALFEYVGDRQIEEPCPSLAHLKCERCGRLIHLECDEVSKLESHILESHGFRLNPKRTVFYGLCRECLEEDGKN